MPFNIASYFAGVGTVACAIVVGFGGGLLLSGSSSKTETPNRLERVMSAATNVSNSMHSTSAPEQLAGAQAGVSIRRVDEIQLPAPASVDQLPFQQALTAPEERAAKASEVTVRSESPLAAGKVRQRKRSVVRERMEKRKYAQRRWAEQREQQDIEAPLRTQREALVVREAVESNAEPAPRLSFFGED